MNEIIAKINQIVIDIFMLLSAIINSKIFIFIQALTAGLLWGWINIELFRSMWIFWFGLTLYQLGLCWLYLGNILLISFVTTGLYTAITKNYLDINIDIGTNTSRFYINFILQIIFAFFSTVRSKPLKSLVDLLDFSFRKIIQNIAIIIGIYAYTLVQLRIAVKKASNPVNFFNISSPLHFLYSLAKGFLSILNNYTFIQIIFPFLCQGHFFIPTIIILSIACLLGCLVTDKPTEKPLFTFPTRIEDLFTFSYFKTFIFHILVLSADLLLSLTSGYAMMRGITNLHIVIDIMFKIEKKINISISLMQKIIHLWCGFMSHDINYKDTYAGAEALSKYFDSIFISNNQSSQQHGNTTLLDLM